MKKFILKTFLKIELAVLNIRIQIISNDIQFLEGSSFLEDYFERNRKIDKYERLIKKASSIINTLEQL
jgi:hypothetical protein